MGFLEVLTGALWVARLREDSCDLKGQALIIRPELSGRSQFEYGLGVVAFLNQAICSVEVLLGSISTGPAAQRKGEEEQGQGRQNSHERRAAISRESRCHQLVPVGG